MTINKRIDRNKLLQALFPDNLSFRNKIDKDYENTFRHIICYNDSGSTVSILDGTIKIHKSGSRIVPRLPGNYYNPKRKKFLHRITIVCENCKKDIPFGRYDQHYKTKNCEQVITLGESLWDDFLELLKDAVHYRQCLSHPYLDYLNGDNPEQYIDTDQINCLKWIIEKNIWPTRYNDPWGENCYYNWDNLEECPYKWNLPITRSKRLSDMIQSYVQSWRICNNKNRVPILNGYYAAQRSR